MSSKRSFELICLDMKLSKGRIVVVNFRFQLDDI